MTLQQTISDAVNEFIEDSGRVDAFVNGGDELSYLTEAGEEVPSIRKYLKHLSNIVGNVNAQADGYIIVQQPISGSVVRTQDEKNAETISIKDIGAVANGIANDLTPINKAIAGTFPTQNIFSDGGVYFVSEKPTNPLGKKFTNGARILMNAPQGGQVQINTYGDDDGKVILGKEYLYRVWKRVEVGESLKVFIYGDSTVATAANGGGYAGVDFEPQNLLPLMLSRKGMLIPQVIINRAVGGTSIHQMNAIPDIDTISGTTDLLIVKYGINDAGRGINQFADDMREKLAAIRASAFGSVENLSIVLMMPSSVYDPQHGRSSAWFEMLRGIYVQAARDYKCVLFDTYAYLRDVDWASGLIMDNPYGNGQGVHPTSIMQNMIWAGLVDHLFTSSEMLMYSQCKDMALTLRTATNYGGTFKRATVCMGSDGYVSMSGMVNLNGATAGSAIATPPLPYFAAEANNEDLFYCPNNTATPAMVKVNGVNGNLELFYVPSGCVWLSLSGIRYKARNRQ